MPGTKKTRLPDLLLVVPCVKSIIDKDDNLVSMIDVINELTLPSTEFTAATTGADQITAALPWHLLTIWRRTTDKTETFVQSVEIIDPDGKRIFSNKAEFATTHGTHRIRLRSRGFRLTVPGDYWIEVFVSPLGGRRKRVGRYPITVKVTDETPQGKTNAG